MTSRYIVHMVLALGLTLLASCGRSVQVSTDYDPSVKFDAFTTYAWLPEPATTTPGPRIRNDLVDARVKRAVNSELATRGFREVSEKSAQLGLNYYVSLEQQISIDTVPTTSFGYSTGTEGWYGGGGSMVYGNTVQTQVRTYEVGTLILDIVDEERKQLIWRGTGSTRVTPTTSPEEADALVNDVVARMLADFPPGYAKSGGR